MRKVFLLVMMCLLIVLSVSCKSKNEQILEKVKKNVPSEVGYKNSLITKYCTDVSSLTKNETENSEKCIKIISDTETEYNKKFLSLLDFYSDNKMSIEEMQELYNEIEEEKLKEVWSRIETLISNMSDSYDGDDILTYTYKKISMTNLIIIDMLEEPGIYVSEIEEIKNNNDIEWQKNTTQKLQIRSGVIRKKEKIPYFSNHEARDYAEKYLEYIETCEVYAVHNEKDKLLDYHKKTIESLYNDMASISPNMSDEDEEKLLNYMEEKKKESDELIKKLNGKK